MASTRPSPKGNGEHERKTAYKRKLFESRREREFYSYYESVLAHANSEPKFCNLDSPEAVERHVAVSSTNKTLTALTQLASLRLGTRRAMIFFFDSEYAYIIAESTRTLSLHDDADHAPGDDLWLGFTKIPRGYSVCEVTAELPANEGSNAQDPGTQSIAHIVNNLAEDTRFCDRPYVLGGPRARFYAGVPITTPKGFNIGALCVLDDKPRQGLEDGQVEFLRDLASTIMSHLSLVRAKEDNQRSHNMTTALGAFVEGKSKSRDWWHRSAHASSSPNLASSTQWGHSRTVDDRKSTSSQPSDSGDVLAAKLPSNTSNASLGPTKADENPSAAALPYRDSAPDQAHGTEQSTSTRPTRASRTKSNESSGPATPPREKFGEIKRDLSARVKEAVTRAAGLIQEGLRADGVLFLDAAIGTFGGLIDGAQGLSQTETETDVSLASDHSVSGGAREGGEKGEPSASTVNIAETTKQSIALGSAYSADVEARVRDAMQQAKFSDKTLRSLLRRYPDGRVWHFNADGDASDEDENDTDRGMSSTSAGESAGSELENPRTPSHKRASRRIRSIQRDARAIQSIFPGIRSVVFLGMWDPHQERWFGASVVLSYSSTRMFSVRNELSYLAAFCDVVLGEIWRLEAQELGRSKSDFISTISHELRTPLHGILGSAECLEEQAQTLLSRELLRSITSCGTTLLEVINDLLEYSRLNHSTRKRKMTESKKVANHDDASDGESGVMIDALTEDAVDAACLGFEQQSVQRNGSSMANDEHATILTLNIEEAQSLHWLSDVGGGAWKRICLNLVTNALKYTHSGYISVTLRKKWLQHSAKKKSARVELVVEDSGIGMSDEFQAKRLFKPFQQESSLAPGTGLGLNLVAQMVRDLGGNVRVQSRIGDGTTVVVSLPLRGTQPPPSSTPTTIECNLAGLNHVKFIGFGCNKADSTEQDLGSKAEKRLLNSLERYCKQMGLSTAGDDVTLNDFASLHIIREQALVSSSPQRLVFAAQQPKTLVIVICATRASALRQRVASSNVWLPLRTEYLWLPIGPMKLANAVKACMLNTNTESGELLNADEDASLNSSSDALDLNSLVAKTSPALSGGDVPNVQFQSGAGPAVDSADAELTRDASRVSTLPRYDRTGGGSALSSNLLSLQMRPQISRTNTSPDEAGSALSLLLVDDNAVNLSLLKAFAKRCGHSYRLAGNGQEAVEAYEKATQQTRRSDDPQASRYDQGAPIAKPEVVLMDINMPVMDGFEAARNIRRFEQASGCLRATIIAITGLGDTAAQQKSFTSGMDLFLTKPVKLKELAAILSEVRRNGA